jgi:N6-L-threonylcarbamoyladenine synthase
VPPSNKALVLGVETSCDETSVAVVRGGREVLSNAVSSQIALHAEFGGVVPEIASRQHVKAISDVARIALSEAGVSMREIDLVAATRGPGLAGALLVGLNFARGLGLGLGAPVVGVNHLDGHLHSVWLTRESPPGPAPELPMVALIVSGGHTELVLMRGHGHYELLGRTLDDAAGEAFDKVARILGLPYPGGPAIQAAAAGATHPVRLPRAWLPGTFDFSFSGLKTAVLHLAFETATGADVSALRGTALQRVEIAGRLSSEDVANIAAGFQESVVEVLVRKTLEAADAAGAASVAVVGGVAANRALRERMSAEASRPLFMSAPEFSTDNAAMIAAAGHFVPPAAQSDVDPGLQLSG